MGEPSVLSLPAMLDRIPDPRKARGRRHPWAALLLIVGALVTGRNTQRAIARWGADLGPAGRARLGFTELAPDPWTVDGNGGQAAAGAAVAAGRSRRRGR